VRTTTSKEFQANYINALAVSVSPFFEPAMVTLGGLIFSPWVDFYDIGWIIFSDLVNS
jgi:hypothetical protein